MMMMRMMRRVMMMMMMRMRMMRRLRMVLRFFEQRQPVELVIRVSQNNSNHF